ncbi:MAG TPA: hypothetical protein VIK55_19900 [Paludibacter sp.]
MRYTIDELDLKNDTYEEAVRTRKIFDEIKTRAQNNEKIFEHEKNFFCKGVLLSKVGNTTPQKNCNVWNLDTGGGWEGKITIMNVDNEEFWQSDKCSNLYPEIAGRG